MDDEIFLGPGRKFLVLSIAFSVPLTRDLASLRVGVSFRRASSSLKFFPFYFSAAPFLFPCIIESSEPPAFLPLGADASLAAGEVASRPFLTFVRMFLRVPLSPPFSEGHPQGS